MKRRYSCDSWSWEGKTEFEKRVLPYLLESYNHLVMEQVGYGNTPGTLDAVFAALADPTRRAILARLADGTATVGELGEPFEISQPAISKHLKVLENAGLIRRDVQRQTRPATLNAKAMKSAVAWLEEFRDHWADRFDQLDQLLGDLKNEENK